MLAQAFGRVRTTLALAAIAAAAVLLLAATGANAKGKTPKTTKPLNGPHGLAFYKPPKHIPKRHGTLIWTRKASGLVPLAGARYTKLVLYSSRSTDNRRIAVSGSVAVPRGKPPKGGWPVITWAHGTTGVADSCAPSRDFAGTPTPTGETYINPELTAWLQAGYAVLRTDYEGLGTPGTHPYLVNTSEGRSVLDIVSAARQLDPAIGRRFLIAGHSQGGHAALSAAGLAQSWAKGLFLRGTVAFAPASHLLEQSQLLPILTSPSSLSGVAILILHGASTQSSQIQPSQILSDQAFALYPLLEQQCLSQLGQPNEYGGIAPANLERPGADTTALNAALAAMNPVVRSNAPIQIEQGTADTTVFKAFTDDLVTQLTNAGNQPIYKTYNGVNHGGVVSAGESDALAFFEQQLPPRR